MGQAGFAAVEVPINGILLKKFVRDLKEDPWELVRMVARKMPNTVKACMAGGNLNPFGAPSPRAVARLFYERVAAIGGLGRGPAVAQTHRPRGKEISLAPPPF